MCHCRDTFLRPVYHKPAGNCWQACFFRVLHIRLSISNRTSLANRLLETILVSFYIPIPRFFVPSQLVNSSAFPLLPPTDKPWVGTIISVANWPMRATAMSHWNLPMLPTDSPANSAMPLAAFLRSCSTAGFRPSIQYSRLVLSSRKSIKPMKRIPFSLRHGLMLPLTTTIFLKESFILTRDCNSCSSFSLFRIANADCI